MKARHFLAIVAVFACVSSLGFCSSGCAGEPAAIKPAKVAVNELATLIELADKAELDKIRSDAQNRMNACTTVECKTRAVAEAFAAESKALAKLDLTTSVQHELATILLQFDSCKEQQARDICEADALAALTPKLPQVQQLISDLKAMVAK